MSTNAQAVVDLAGQLSTAAAAAQNDYLQLEKEYEASQADLQTANQENETLIQQNASLQDDLSAAQQSVSTLTSQAGQAAKWAALVQQLAKYNANLHLQQLPFTKDPNARPTLIWFQPGNSGNTGGASAAKHGTWDIADNQDWSRDFSIQPVAAFDDYIWGLNIHQKSIPLSRALQVTEFEVADEDVAGLTGIETNFEHSINLTRRNAGIQALLGKDKDFITGQIVTNQWRYFDIGLGAWMDTGIPLDRTLFGTGKHIELISEFTENSDGSVTNVSLTINGALHSLNKTTKPKATTWPAYLQIGWQMDPLVPVSMKTKVWNMELWWL
ncbi:MAG TPA: hypothetical protein VFB79_18670 [Candidatus Angelobacter sp.]|nr:hypothetical protein [Candidatus Angelobacter sp.]